VLPAPIAVQLKYHSGIIADGFGDVSVLFADVVGFTSLTASIVPTALIELPNRVLSGFDELVDVGDAYMVAGGLLQPHVDHRSAMATMASVHLVLTFVKSARRDSGTMSELGR
jgi:adenylate cyclase